MNDRQNGVAEIKENEVVHLFDSDVIFRSVSTAEVRQRAVECSAVNVFNVSGGMQGKPSWSKFMYVSRHSSGDTKKQNAQKMRYSNQVYPDCESDEMPALSN